MALYVPTFNGQTIFGVSYSLAVTPYPHQIAWATFPGVNGRFGMREGSRGFFADAVIFQTAANEDYLGAFEDIWNTYVNTAYMSVLFDTLGRTWPLTVCTEFNAPDEVKAYGGGRMARSYRLRFEILY